MSFIARYRTQLKQHTTGTLLLSALIFFTVLLVILRLSLSAIIILSTERWLATQQLDASIQRIEISLFSGHVSLQNAEAKNTQQQGFKIGELTLDWNWLPLFSKHVEINQITLRDFSISAELYHDGGLNIGGIKLPANAADNATSGQTEKAQASIWQATVHNIELSKLEACVAQFDQNSKPAMDYCSHLEQLEWQGKLAYLPEITDQKNTSPELPLYVDGQFNLDSFKLHNNLLKLDLLNIAEIKLPDVKIENLNNIQLQTLDISQLALLQQPADKTTEQTATDQQINHLLAFDNLRIGPVSIMQQKQISLGDIALSKLRNRAQINTDNQLDIDAWIPGQITQDADQLTDAGNKTDQKSQADNETSQQNSNSTTIKLGIDNIQLSDTTLCTEHTGNTQLKPLNYCLELDNVHWKGALSYGKKNDKSEDTESLSVPLYANGNFTISQLILKNHSLDLNLLAVDKIQFDTISMQTIDNINIANLDIQQFSSFERNEKNIDESAEPQAPYIFAFDHFKIKPIKLAPNEIFLGKAELTGSQATVIINQQGEAEITQWMVQPPVTENSPAPAVSKKQPVSDTKNKSEKATGNKAKSQTKLASDPASKSLHFSLDELIFHTDRKSIFIDRSNQQLMQLVIELIDIELKNINTAADGEQSTVSLLIRFEDQATLKLNAQGTPLAEKPDIKGSGSISALDLRQISPLTRQQLGQNIRSGQLDAQLDIDVDNGQADSLLDLKLHHFVLRTLNKEEAEKLNKDLGFPLNTSLNLLRDKDNKIQLSIPITQDIDNLNIDIKPVIYKALSKSVSSAIVNYYTPFGLVFVAESLFDLATALKFNPVLFKPTEASLNEASKTELEKLATIMTERPGIHLTLCGFSNLNDMPQENAKSANQSASKKPAVELSAEQRQQLLQLAGSRSSVVKQYLINAHQISASRLVECEAEYAADAIAGVEIKL